MDSQENTLKAAWNAAYGRNAARGGPGGDPLQKKSGGAWTVDVDDPPAPLPTPLVSLAAAAAARTIELAARTSVVEIGSPVRVAGLWWSPLRRSPSATGKRCGCARPVRGVRPAPLARGLVRFYLCVRPELVEPPTDFGHFRLWD